MKNRNNGSAASTVAASTGSGGSTSNFAPHVMHNTLVASRIGLKRWEIWRNIRGARITMDEARNLVSKITNHDSRCRLEQVQLGLD